MGADEACAAGDEDVCHGFQLLLCQLSKNDNHERHITQKEDCSGFDWIIAWPARRRSFTEFGLTDKLQNTLARPMSCLVAGK
jgi:hypothetical protein